MCIRDSIKEFTVLKKSVDARKKEQIFFIYQVDFFTENEKRVLSRYKKNDVTIKSEKKENYTAKCEAAAEKDTSEKIVIAGFGPAGLFAAYELALSGYKPLVIERGLDAVSYTHLDVYKRQIWPFCKEENFKKHYVKHKVAGFLEDVYKRQAWNIATRGGV